MPKNRFLKYVAGGFASIAIASNVFFNVNCASTLQRPSSLEKKINQTPREKYAVLISAESEPRHVYNLNWAYQTLSELGYFDKNMYVFDDSSANSNIFIRYALTTKKNILKLLNNLSKEIDSNDIFFLYVTGHGYIEPNNDDNLLSNNKIEDRISYIEMKFGEYLYSTELKEYLANIQPEVGICLFDQCHSGGFAELIGGENYVAISAYKKDESSQDNGFPIAFFTSFKKKLSSEIRIGDSNSDGRVSIYEAFIHAKVKDIYSLNGRYHPQLKSILNSDKIFLDGKK